MTSELAERKLSLFEIEQSLSMLMQDRDEVTDPEEIAAVDAAIRDYVSQEIRKVDGIRAYIRHSETMAAAAKEEAARAASVAQAWQTRIDRLKSSCLVVMQEIGAKRLDGKGGYLIVKGNGGLAPLLVTDETAIPLDCKKATVAMPADEWEGMREHMLDIGMTLISERIDIDAKAIREAIIDTGGIPGARISERGSHIEVK